MKINLEVPQHAAWSPTEQAATNNHLNLIYANLAPTVENDYSIGIMVLTDAQRRQHQVEYGYRFEPFAVCEDQDNSMGYSEHWFVLPAYRGAELVTSEQDGALVSGVGA